MRARIDGAGLRRRDRSPATSPSTRGCRNCRSGTQSGAGRLPTTPLFIAVLVWMVFAGASVARAVSPASSPGQLERVPLHGLCVTNGVISTLSDGRLAIDSPSSRAVARNIGYQGAEIRMVKLLVRLPQSLTQLLDGNTGEVRRAFRDIGRSPHDAVQ